MLPVNIIRPHIQILLRKRDKTYYKKHDKNIKNTWKKKKEDRNHLKVCYVTHFPPMDTYNVSNKREMDFKPLASTLWIRKVFIIITKTMRNVYTNAHAHTLSVEMVLNISNGIKWFYLYFFILTSFAKQPNREKNI